jgi:hypothetical protein
MFFQKVSGQEFGRDCILVFFADENIMFLVEEEVRAHDDGFRLDGFRLSIQGQGHG